MKVEELWRWRIQWNKRWCTTRYDCTEEAILKQHPEAIRVEGTLIKRTVPETEAERREAHYVGLVGHLQVLSKNDP